LVERQRLDKWLWHARVVKTRTDAASLASGGDVRVNGARNRSPGDFIKLGDKLTITLDRSIRILEVTGFIDRRGDAAAARAIYTELQRLRD
jgi:ribosome-associated heat shock protein Hsp15